MKHENSRPTRTTVGLLTGVAAVVALGVACGHVSSDPDYNLGGSSGSSGAASGGSAGSGNTANGGNGGSGVAGTSSSAGGSSGSGGISGSGGSSGGSGSSGSGGSGSGTSGSAGSSGSSVDAGVIDGGSSDAGNLDGGSIGNLVSNPDFEAGIAPWTAAFGGTLAVTTEQAHGGSQSAKITERTQAYQGAHYDLTDFVTSATSYAVSAFGRIGNGATSTAAVKLTARLTCSSQTLYLPIVSLTGSDSAWTELTGTLTLPTSGECSLVEVLLYIEGPPAAYDLYVDDVSVTAL